MTLSARQTPCYPPSRITHMERKIVALRAENERLVGWLRRHARYVRGRTDETEWKELMKFLDTKKEADSLSE